MAQSTSKQVVVLAAIVWAALSSSAGAQVADSLQCFKVKDPLKLKGIVDIDGASLGLAPGCKISRAKQYCTAATSSVQTATAQGNPLALLPISGPNPGDRVCYRVRCPSTSANQEISDQFGNRTVEIGSVKTLCVPAVAGPPPGQPGGTMGGMCLVPQPQEPAEFVLDCDTGGDEASGTILSEPDGSTATLRVLSMYEPYSAGLPVGTATVVVSNPGERTILLLSSYETVHWDVRATAGAEIERVILTAYEPVTATVPAGVPIENLSPFTLTPWIDDYEDWPVDWPSADADLLISVAQDLTGLCATSFHGCYRSSQFAVPAAP